MNSAGEKKIVWQNKPPTGAWDFLFVDLRSRIMPTSVDITKPLLWIKFSSKGNDAFAWPVLYGVVAGTTNVYRSIGQGEQNELRIYRDDEMKALEKWHIVLISTAECDRPLQNTF